MDPWRKKVFRTRSDGTMRRGDDMASTATAFSTIRVDTKTPVARITLNRPPVNVIDLTMMDELLAAFEQLERQPGISTIVLAGSERAFSAGVDVKAHTADKVHEMLAKFHSVIRAQMATRKVTIASVRGSCLGGGAEMALMCDLVYTSKDATWGFPEIRLACFPPVAAAALAALVGPKQAADLIFTGRTLKGDEAFALGLANGVAADADVESLVNDAAQRLQPLSPAALSMAKKAFYAWDAMHLDKGLARAEKIYLEELMQTDDAKEGIQSFIEKRPPVWKGK
jgi:cyclohexa-1,5-dienecarbonyl-CoA hydratase